MMEILGKDVSERPAPSPKIVGIAAGIKIFKKYFIQIFQKLNVDARLALKNSMNITTAQVKEIRLELAKLKPVKVTLDGNRSMTVKETILALTQVRETYGVPHKKTWQGWQIRL